ncbi:hypothetical protein SDB66_15065, partial [Legionella pneumophila serogroup 6]|nr:hypothetical protein [Legionella pneumophila]
DFSLPSLKIERSVYTLNPFQKITILIRFQSISRAFDNFHSLLWSRLGLWFTLSQIGSWLKPSRNRKGADRTTHSIVKKRKK